jgi:hypothetical protein
MGFFQGKIFYFFLIYVAEIKLFGFLSADDSMILICMLTALKYDAINRIYIV